MKKTDGTFLGILFPKQRNARDMFPGTQPLHLHGLKADYKKPMAMRKINFLKNNEVSTY